MGKLKELGSDASFNGSQVTDLGELETVGGFLDLRNTKITNLGKLKSVGHPGMYGNAIYLNEYINPKDAERIVKGGKINYYEMEQPKETTIKKPANNQQTSKTNSKIEQPKKETIDKPTNNNQKQKTDEKPSLVQRLKAAWKVLKGN